MSDMTAWKARRLAGRTLRVLERHGSQPAVKTYVPTLGRKATEYGNAYDESSKYGPSHTREFKEGRTALAALVRGIKTWTPIVAGAIVGFGESDYGDNPQIADDTIADAERLLDVVTDATDAAGQPLSFAADLSAELTPLLTAAIKECGEAEAADVRLQELLKAQRDTLAPFDEELQRFRRTLLGVLGRSHKDYQKLRTAKSRERDEDDDPGVPIPPAPADNDVT